MSLSSDSSLDEVLAAYDDNCDYDLTADVTKAQNFIIACRILLRRLTGDSTFQESRTVNSPNLAQIRQELSRALEWWSANAGDQSGGVTFASMENFRD
jgi:hypothetical protein